MSKPKKGDIVDMVGRGLGGKFVSEGKATVVSEEKYNGMYDVHFEGDPKDAIYLRYVDLEAQGRVEEYLKELNKLNEVKGEQQ